MLRKTAGHRTPTDGRLGALLVFALAVGGTGYGQTEPATKEEIAELVRSSDAQLLEERATAEVIRQRAASLSRLFRMDAQEAVSLSLSREEVQDLIGRFPNSAADLETHGEWEGPVEVIEEDDFEAGRSRTSIRLMTTDGELELWGADSAILRSDGVVRVKGIRLGSQVAVSSSSIVERQMADAGCNTIGDQKTVVLLVEFPSKPLPALYRQDFVRDTFFGLSRTVTDFLRENSYGMTNASGDVFGPFRLDRDYGCSESSAVRTAAIRAADSTVDFRQYTRIFIVMPEVSGCDWSGAGTLGCSSMTSQQGAFTASSTWLLAYWWHSRDSFSSVAAHEFGHNLGLQHARSLDYDTVELGAPGPVGVRGEYEDPFSNMGRGFYFTSTNKGSGYGHFAAYHKLLLGWLQAGKNLLNVESPGHFTLQPFETPSTFPQALRVRRGADSDEWLTLEYRQPVGNYDFALNPSAFSGALVHYEDAASKTDAPYTDLLDFTPAHTPNDFFDAPLPSGKTWEDTSSPLTLEIGSARPDGLDVTIRYDPQCATLSPQRQTHGPGAEVGSISVLGEAGCSWTATSTADWITITGGSAGNGPGTVSYLLAANTTKKTRIGSIVITRQSYVIRQADDVSAYLAEATPEEGSGASRTFHFVVRNATRMTSLDVLFSTEQGLTAHQCRATYYRGGPYFWLWSDAADDLNRVAVESEGTVENSQCVLDAGTSRISIAGDEVMADLAFRFKSPFAGKKNLYAAVNLSSARPWLRTGTWTVIAVPERRRARQRERQAGRGLPRQSISPVRVNSLAPDDDTAGDVTVEVTTAQGASGTSQPAGSPTTRSASPMRAHGSR